MSSWLFAFLVLVLISLVLLAVIIIKAPDMEKDELDSIMSEDLDQAERDYYDREAEKQASSCMFSFKMLALMALLYGFFHLVRYLFDLTA